MEGLQEEGLMGGQRERSEQRLRHRYIKLD